MSSAGRRIEKSTISSLVKAASYAVRGPIVTRSMELKEALTKTNTLPFKAVVSCNIGNPHSLEQKPLSFIRDVVSVVVNPSLKGRASFPPDVIERADRYLAGLTGGAGAYTESQGIPAVRADVAAFLEQRDGYKADPANIFLTNGASEGVRLCMQTILRDPSTGAKDGILTPIPQYPLYSALTTLLQGHLVAYYLDESKDWSCTTENLTKSLNKATAEGVTTRALVVINPGNPTGQVLTETDMRAIVEFCVKENICLMADEVYQENIWNKNKKFVSFRKVAHDTGALDRGLQLISFHSISKGFLGECGLRGGYFELLGLPAEVKQEIYKLASISLCSNTVGQIATGVMVQPPKQGSASHATYVAERDGILSSLQRRADMLSKALNALPGMSCNSIEGAMYAFPTIKLPSKLFDHRFYLVLCLQSGKAVKKAEELEVAPDAFYCSQLLEETGIVVVPGSGFGQADGTFHFRTTILPPEDSLQGVVERLKVFHEDFLKKYA